MNLNEMIQPGNTIGIIGGGQLGKMLTLSAKEMGFRVGILDPTPDCPASHVADWHFQAPYENKTALKQFAEKCDVLTYEFENVDALALSEIEKSYYLPQGSDLLAITQDRLLEKAYLEEHNIIIAPYATIVDLEDVENAVESIGFPCVLKTVRGGYDGKGQIVLYEKQDIGLCEELLETGSCVLEAWIPFERELSVMVARNAQSSISVFPVAENIHRNNILHQSIVPARIPEDVSEEIERIAIQIASSLDLRGVLGIEMFLTSSGSIYVNELAPRPHNSGHYSIEACTFSQFDLHIRGICGWPLPKPKLLSTAVMTNVLGQHLDRLIDQIPLQPQWHIHLYNKDEARQNRKVGHVTVLVDRIEDGLRTFKDSAIWD